MWVTLARGVFIYGTHMTRNITTNNATNTQTLVQSSSQKKTLNKCHTNHPVVVKPLNKQATKFWFWDSASEEGEFKSLKNVGVSIVNLNTFFLSLFFIFHCLFSALCMKRREVGGSTSKVSCFFFLRLLL